MLNQKTWLVVLAVFLASAMVLACPNESGCRECGFDSQQKPVCLYCDFGYLDPDTKTCQNNIGEKISNCLTYKQMYNSLACLECESGFFSDINGKCQPCSSKDCAICHDNGECSACKNSIVLIYQSCESKQKCNDVNCAICVETETASICHSCNAGFMRNELGICATALENCDIGNSSNRTCVRCASGYFVSETGKCLKLTQAGISIIWWILIILCILAIGYFSYYHFILKKKERAAADAEYVFPADDYE